VEKARLAELRGFFEEAAGGRIFALRDQESVLIDAALSAGGATIDLVETLERAGPYGAGHAAPLLVLPRHILSDARVVGTNHVRAELRSETGQRLAAIAFRAADNDLGRFLLDRRGHTIHAVGTLAINHWNGNRTVQLRMVDAAAA
jgi:single-stranded-DNA-specific exonuclease